MTSFFFYPFFEDAYGRQLMVFSLAKKDVPVAPVYLPQFVYAGVEKIHDDNKSMLYRWPYIFVATETASDDEDNNNNSYDNKVTKLPWRERLVSNCQTDMMAFLAFFPFFKALVLVFFMD